MISVLLHIGINQCRTTNFLLFLELGIIDMITYSWLITNGDIIVDAGTILLEAVFCDAIYDSPLFINFAGVSSSIVKGRFDLHHLIKTMNRFQLEKVVVGGIARWFEVSEIKILNSYSYNEWYKDSHSVKWWRKEKSKFWKLQPKFIKNIVLMIWHEFLKYNVLVLTILLQYLSVFLCLC